MPHGRLKLFIIFGVFVGPLLAAFVWYYGFDGALGLRGGKNFAPLVSPPLALQPFANLRVDDDINDEKNFTLDSLKSRWHIVHSLPSVCDAVCDKVLYNTRQTRLALGRDANRLRRILLADDATLLMQLADEHPDTVRILKIAGGLGAQLATIRERYNLTADDALLIDPLGNVMMIIPADLSPRLLLKDLKHLLRVSRIG